MVSGVCRKPDAQTEFTSAAAECDEYFKEEGKSMNAFLMHKNIETAVIEYDQGRIFGLSEIVTPDHMPVGTYYPGMDLKLSEVFLRAWQKSRLIPSDRINLKALGIDEDGICQLSLLSHGIGLTDQYWIKEEKECINWEDINYHQNGFNNSPFFISGESFPAFGPDSNTNGCLPKCWILMDGIPMLLKDSPSWLPTASANEVVAYQIAQLCGVPHAIYFPLKLGNHTYCASPCFVQSDREEFIPMISYLRTHRIPTRIAIQKSGLPNTFFNEMTAFDLLIGNTDRHEGNFGYIRSADTLEFIKPAPLFDSGTALHSVDDLDYFFKPVFRTRNEALKKVSIPFLLPDINCITDILESVYKDFGLDEYIFSATKELSRNISDLNEKIIKEQDVCL